MRGAGLGFALGVAELGEALLDAGAEGVEQRGLVDALGGYH
jgi:hypothetical protein